MVPVLLADLGRVPRIVVENAYAPVGFAVFIFMLEEGGSPGEGFAVLRTGGSDELPIGGTVIHERDGVNTI